MFGREAKLPIDLMFKVDEQPQSAAPEYAVQLKESLTEVYERVCKATNAEQVLQKQLYDRKVHGDPYKEGDYVWLHSTVLQKG